MKKQIASHAACVASLIIIAIAFVPRQVFRGEMVGAVDYEKYVGMSHEAVEWDAKHPQDRTAWTGAAFSGTPTIVITGTTQGDRLHPLFEFISQKGHRPLSSLLLSLLGAFVLMIVLGVKPLLAVGGAVAITFCSYNPQIIQAGHNTKMLAIAYAPWVLAAMIFTYKKALDEGTEGWKRWLPAVCLGAALFGFAIAFQIKANHVQITWYLALISAIYVAGLAIRMCLSKERLSKLWGRFLIASGLLLAAGAAGFATNACKLIPMWEYTSQATRGGSELSGKSKEGLSLDYTTAWSYGWEELPNLMIPNFNGGPSKGRLPKISETRKLIGMSDVKDKEKAAEEQPLYWGPQPSTAGPMYVGAISLFLFILGLLICEGKDKWWMLAAALLSIGLALGNNLMPLTRFFYGHVPFYSKFRAVSMSLVSLQFVIPMLGFLALEKILKGGVEKKSFLKKGLAAFAVTGGICLIFSLFPGLAGDFKASMDANLSDIHANALIQDRKTMLRGDAFVSFLLIAATFLLLFFSCGEKAGKFRRVAAVAICALVIVNMFGTSKRYLNDNHFFKWKEFNDKFAEREVDKSLLSDTSPSFRVADLTVDIFNDSWNSYFHKSIGGYNAAKLQRYQDLIERHITDELKNVRKTIKEHETIVGFNENLGPIPALSMLNTKYFIVDADWPPVLNPQAMGNAWFVKGSATAATPDEEIDLIGKTDLGGTAVLGPDFKDVFIPPAAGENDWIELVSYAPNELRYRYSASKPRAAVFSEIYYPFGWRASLESGERLEIFRADWTLRGAVVPAGSHEITMRMDPRSYRVGARISTMASFALLALLLIAVCGFVVVRK